MLSDCSRGGLEVVLQWSWWVKEFFSLPSHTRLAATTAGVSCSSIALGSELLESDTALTLLVDARDKMPHPDACCLSHYPPSTIHTNRRDNQLATSLPAVASVTTLISEKR